jgi:hypothetical protein
MQMNVRFKYGKFFVLPVDLVALNSKIYELLVVH